MPSTRSYGASNVRHNIKKHYSLPNQIVQYYVLAALDSVVQKHIKFAYIFPPVANIFGNLKQVLLGTCVLCEERKENKLLDTNFMDDIKLSDMLIYRLGLESSDPDSVIAIYFFLDKHGNKKDWKFPAKNPLTYDSSFYLIVGKKKQKKKRKQRKGKTTQP